MLQTTKQRDRWVPESEDDAERVRQSLEGIVRTPRFSSSKRYPALLRYVVEKSLEGQADTLKERTIGIEVFSRPPNYDTGSDTVVRYTAGEVRKRLSLYYHEEGAEDPIQIELPSGSYVPEFYAREVETLEPRPQNAELASSQQVRFVLPEESSVSPAPRAKIRSYPRSSLALVLTAAVLVLACAVGWRVHTARASKEVFVAFWAPLREVSPPNTVLVSPSAVVFSPNEKTGVDPAQSPTQDALLSPETARSMSRVSDLLGAAGIPFTIRLPATVSKDELQRHPAILIGAYNNRLTLQATDQLPYRFSARSTQSIYDATQPSVSWARPRSWENAPGNDYALFARFRDPVSHEWTYVVAGLGRTGTEAAAMMITSPEQMAAVADRLPKRWKSENLEVVLRVEVRASNSTPVPNVEAVSIWK